MLFVTPCRIYVNLSILELIMKGDVKNDRLQIKIVINKKTTFNLYIFMGEKHLLIRLQYSVIGTQQGVQNPLFPFAILPVLNL